MSASRWKITSHVIPASHARGYARGSVDAFSDSQIRLAVKQYTPLNNLTPSRGDVTLIMSGGIGVPKESFEPFFDALLTASGRIRGFRIRSIWTADPWSWYESYTLNEDLVGDDPNWCDHTRDLYQLINHFQADMPPPIIGMGESWGVGHFLMMSTWHPRLLAGILALEPALGPGHPLKDGMPRTQWPAPPRYFPAVMISKRNDRWATREDAIKHLSKSPFYATMDPRVREVVFKYDLRDVNHESGSYVTLATPKRIEAQFWGRMTKPRKGLPEYPPHEQPNSASKIVPGIYQLAGPIWQEATRHVTVPVMFLWGDKSHISEIPGFKQSCMRRYGSAEGAGGGMKTGQLSEATVKGAGHAITLCKPVESADATVEWLAKTTREWMEDYERRRTGGPFEKKFPDEWVDMVKDLSNMKELDPSIKWAVRM